MPEMPAPPPMPEIAQATESEEPVQQNVDLTASMAALDGVEDTSIFDAAPPIADVEIEALSTDLLTESNEVPPEETIDDYKWKDTVLQKILAKYDITDKDSFLDHAMAFDRNGNHYLTKSDLAEAAIAWVSAIDDGNTDVDVDDGDLAEVDEVDVTVDEIESSPEIESLEVSEPTFDLPPPPLPVTTEAPPPVPVTEASIPLQELEAVESIEVDEGKVDDTVHSATESYADLWKRRSDKSLPQMYGAIDRIGSGEIGSLLERYSDRFGHELDREIIVMRKAEQDALREATPTVELISAPKNDDDAEQDDEVDELEARVNEVVDILRPLQNAYKSAESKKEKRRLAPALKALIAERKALLSVIAGDEDESILAELPDRPDIPQIDDEGPEDEEADVVSDTEEDIDHFVEFCSMIDTLLGKMPEEWIGDFMNSNGFKLYQKVASEPESSTQKTRAKFFKMIDKELVSMPSDLLDEFMESEEFQLYRIVGEEYGG